MCYLLKMPLIQEMFVIITSSCQVIEVSPLAIALIGHLYLQYQHTNAVSCDDRVSVVNPTVLLFFRR